MSGTVGTGGTGISLSLLHAHAHLSQHKKMVVPVVPPVPRLSIKGARQRQSMNASTYTHTLMIKRPVQRHLFGLREGRGYNVEHGNAGPRIFNINLNTEH